MKYWLLKSEPDVFSIDDLYDCKDRTEPWDGIRNYQARNFMRDEMQINDSVFSITLTANYLVLLES